MLKLASLGSLVAFVLIGCGGSGERSKASIVNHSSKAVSIEGLKSLEKNRGLKTYQTVTLKIQQKMLKVLRVKMLMLNVKQEKLKHNNLKLH